MHTPQHSPDVAALSRQKFDWQVDADAAAYADLFADDGTFVHANGAVQSKAEFVAALASGELDYSSIELREFSAREYGSTAVITGTADITTVIDSAPKLYAGLVFTETYAHDGARWRLVAVHYSQKD